MKEEFRKQGWIYALAVLCALFWGFSFLGTQTALKEMEVIPLLSLRWTVAAVCFLLIFAVRGIKIRWKGRRLRDILLLGALQPCLYSIFETTGIKHTTPSESSILIAMIPLMVIIIGALFLHRKSSRRTVLAVIIALLGVTISIVFSPSFSLGGKWFGYLSLFIAVTLGGFYSHVSKKAAESFTAMETTMGISVMSAVFFNLLNFFGGYGFSGYRACIADFRTMSSVLFLGVCCSCICYLLYNDILGKLPAAIGSNITANGTTIVGILSGIFFTGDPFGWYTVIGVGLALTGICLASSGREEIEKRADC